MKHMWRFVFGCALGVGAGYALTLLLSPGRSLQRPQRVAIRERDGGSGEAAA